MQKEEILKIDSPGKRIAALPCWQSTPAIRPLQGGMTNHNFHIRCDDQEFVVRLGQDIPEHLIVRSNEVIAHEAAQAAGVSPALKYHEPGVMVMDYIDAPSLSSEQVRDPARLKRIVALIKTAHDTMPAHLHGQAAAFWVFHVIRHYAATLIAGDSRYQVQLPHLLMVNRKLEQAAGPFDIVYGHNDLLPGNLLDDGNRLWLIDWEYAGFNTPLFDLGGLASNNELEEPAERWILEQYFQEPVASDLWRRYQAMKCASLLRESLWSMVSELHSSLTVDYAQYTRDNLARYESSLETFQSS